MSEKLTKDDDGSRRDAQSSAITASADSILTRIGLWMADRLRAETSGYEPYTPSDPETLETFMRPGDILLVEGNQYVSNVIKYLTTSTWSHAAIFVGPVEGTEGPQGKPHTLVEVNLGQGCVSQSLERYSTYNTRICRPLGLTESDRERVVRFMIDSIGLKYDMKNIFDMARYFFPVPLPARLRRRAIAFGSGDPTRAICSTLIAEAFQRVKYPILPEVERTEHGDSRQQGWSRREIYRIRHHSLFAPRDFDLSPYFAIVKPTIERGFDYKTLVWHDPGAERHKGSGQRDGGLAIVENEAASDPDRGDETKPDSEEQRVKVE